MRISCIVKLIFIRLCNFRDLNPLVCVIFCSICLNASSAIVGNANKAMLTREVSMIKERLRVVEADSGFLKHAAMTLQVGGEGTKLLNEIVQHLRVLRQTGKSPSDDIDA